MIVVKRVAGAMSGLVRSLRRNQSRWTAWRIRRAGVERTSSRPHDLPAKLVVSLTSYPARFGTLDLTLLCLINQTVKPDRILLWIAHDDLDALPARVRALEPLGVTTIGCSDLRSYKKLIPALEAFPDAFIATADDDVYYPPDWLETLVSNVDPAAAEVVCHRANRISFTAGGEVAPYLDWAFDVQDRLAQLPSDDIVAVGAGGVLYPPRCFHPLVRDQALFQRLCPDGDDIWFYWCARMAGTRYRKVGGRMPLIAWPDSQPTALWEANQRGGNDRMIRALEAELGPLSAPRVKPIQ